MRVLDVVRLGVGFVTALAAGLAAATTIIVTFPEFNGAPHEDTETFPLPPVIVASETFSIPAGEQVASAVISGSWGNSTRPGSTAGVTVLLDGFKVAQCDKPDPNCYVPGPDLRPWTHTFTNGELLRLGDGTALLTAVQTSDFQVRLGASTLVIDTAPLVAVAPPAAVVPTLSPFGLLALLVAIAVAGVLASRRYPRG